MELKRRGTVLLNIQFWVALFLFSFVFSVQTAQAARRVAPVSTETSYLRIENSEAYEKGDPKITSLGFIGFDKDLFGHADLTFIESVESGNGLTLDAGAGYAINWFAHFYLGLGIALGVNPDEEEFIATYYPEAGIVLDVTKSFGISISKKRYFSLYGETEDIIMLGLVFR